jgi:hypothetical protein
VAADPPRDGADAIQDAWRRELPGVPVDSIGVITRIWWAAKVFGDERRRLLAKLGVDVAPLDLLSALRRSGPPYRMSPGELADACMVTRGAITQRVERAARAGLVDGPPPGRLPRARSPSATQATSCSTASSPTCSRPRIASSATSHPNAATNSPTC